MTTIAFSTLRRFLRERSNVFYVFVLPFLVIILVGSGAGSGSRLPLGVVGAETEVGRSVLAELADVDMTSYATRADAARAVGDNKIGAAVVFPTDPAEPISHLSRPGSGLDRRSEIEDAITLLNHRVALEQQATEAGIDPSEFAAAFDELEPTKVTVERIGTAYWEGLESVDAASLTQVVLFTGLAALLTASALVLDRTSGMARRKAAAPIRPSAVVAGESFGRFLVAGFQALLIVVATAIAFGVDWGSPVLTASVLALFALNMTGLSVLIGTVITRPESASGIGVLFALVAAALGGAMAPVELFPPVMQNIARATPQYWTIEALKDTLTGGSLTDIALPLAVLALGATIMLALSATLYQRVVRTGA